MNVLLVAAISGFVAGQLTFQLFGEVFANEYETFYEKAFYIVPPAPGNPESLAASKSEAEYLEQLCKLPSGQTVTAAK